MKGIKTLLGSVITASLLAATPVWAAAPVVTQPKWYKPHESRDAKAKAKEEKHSRSITNIPKEMREALDKLVKQLPELKGLHLRSVEMTEENGDHPEVWEFTLTEKKKGSMYDRDQVRAWITIHAETGELYEYEYHNPDWAGTGDITEKTAKQKADEFLKKLFGSKKKDLVQKQVRIIEDDEDDDDDEEDNDDTTKRKSAYVLYERQIKGIPLIDFDVEVELDGDGHVVAFENQAYVSLEKVAFPNPKKALSQKKAVKAYKELVDMSLIYLFDSRKGHPVLAYEPDFYGPIDAFTGKKSPDLVYFEMQDPQRVEIQPNGNPWVIRSREDAEELLKQVFKLPVEDFEFEGEHDWGDDEDDDSGSISYYWETNQQPWGEVELEVDKKTGRVIWYDADFDTEVDSEPMITGEEALQIASKTLEQLISPNKQAVELTYMHNPFAKEKTPDWVEEDEEEEGPYYARYTLYFSDLYQDIPVAYSGYSIDVDPITSRVLEMDLDAEEDLSDLPEPVDTISPAEAEQAYVDHHPLTLFYLWPRYMGQIAPKPILLYGPKETQDAYIDAFTGNVVDMEEDFEE
ncbi:YcdB/YcdC domain-containing protein [Brevibacillus sp. H7]|uniref:YcdB/YcdC domain-containing protein n=1 Tax=Brevibacillus sp. H7 TaxID=3349138 RepID=UPI00382F7242